MGKSLNQMIEAVADATTGEFERLKEFGIKARTQGEQVTFTFQGIATTVGKNAAEIEGYLRSIGDVQFAGAIKEQGETLNTAISNMCDAFSKMVKAIGDAGLTEILTDIVNAIKWLVEKITESIDPIKIWCLTIITEVTKFGNLFTSVFKGVGDVFTSFADGISARFEALGKDLAAFVEDPLGGVSFENTTRVLENGLVASMRNAFDKALTEAREFNEKLDAEIGAAKSKIAAKNEKKSVSLEEMFGSSGDSSNNKINNNSTNTLGKSSKTKSRLKTESSNDSQDDSKGYEYYITPGFSNENSRLISDGNHELKQTTKDTTKEIEDDFYNLGDQIGHSISSSLTQAGTKFNSFADLAKNVLGDVGKMLLDNLFGGGMGGIGGAIGGLFGGGGGILSGIGKMFGGFFADGGKLSPGKFGVVGENGPELAFAGNSPLNIIPDMPSGGNVTINMNVQTPDIMSFRQSSSQIAADVARQIERARRNL
jgi:phage-related protein